MTAKMRFCAKPCRITKFNPYTPTTLQLESFSNIIGLLAKIDHQSGV
jgi:hypothetical protein